ncbi:hypothetical protein J2X43_004594 [Rhizobium sp. BE258]|nr:hypothetical protein [Rhizobium sp. BE258]
MKSLFPEMSSRQIAIFMIETSVLLAGLAVVLIVTVPMM